MFLLRIKKELSLIYPQYPLLSGALLIATCFLQVLTLDQTKFRRKTKKENGSDASLESVPIHVNLNNVEGWVTADVTSFLTLSYQDDERVIMKGCVQWNPVYGWKDFHLQWVLDLGPLDQYTSI